MTNTASSNTFDPRPPVNRPDIRPATARQSPWWHGAIIYQIYPRSFLDSNGDGIGDLVGISRKLDYIRDLGVDAIWISPFFKSPMNDFGYDISDYRDVDPIFGTLADFDRLIEEAHQRGIRILIDQVLSHTSDQHPWFQESRSSRNNPKADWYVWADPRPDGSPPNNWISIFGGCAWQWESRREQYYLHNFLASQPDLNFHNPEVPKQALAELEFWLLRGVDGVRLDAINFCFHDRLLRDNPPKPPAERISRGFKVDNPYAYQYHTYNNTRPENLAFLEELRRLLNRYPGVVSLGEISSDDSIATMAEYTSGNIRLHTAYNFELMVDRFSAGHIRNTVENMEQRLHHGWPCWSFGNHDIARVMTRWGGDDPSDRFGKLLMALLCSLRGGVCLYQGEELGLTEADIPRELLRDPFGIAFWPMFRGRDGCRTPMPWDAHQKNAGFSAGDPWLPVPKEHWTRAVAQQDFNPDSMLNNYRRFIAWRQLQPALRLGDIEFLDAPNDILVLIRRHPAQTILAAFNFSAEQSSLPLPVGSLVRPLKGQGFEAAGFSEAAITLPAQEAFFGEITLPVSGK